jgi:hypothetical protein
MCIAFVLFSLFLLHCFHIASKLGCVSFFIITFLFHPSVCLSFFALSSVRLSVCLSFFPSFYKIIVPLIGHQSFTSFFCSFISVFLTVSNQKHLFFLSFFSVYLSVSNQKHSTYKKMGFGLCCVAQLAVKLAFFIRSKLSQSVQHPTYEANIFFNSDGSNY